MFFFLVEKKLKSFTPQELIMEGRGEMGHSMLYISK